MRILSPLPLIAVAASLSLAACSESDDSPSGPEKAPLQSDADANRGVDAMLSATAAGRPSSAGLARGGRASSFRSTDAGGDIDASTPCEGGGSISFAGHLDLEIPDVNPKIPEIDPENPPGPEDFDEVNPADYIPNVAFEFVVTFDGCTADGVIIDGEMNYSMETLWDEGGQTVDFAWNYEGAVDFSGAVDGGCAFNFGGMAAGAEDWADADPTALDGDVCGFDAEGVVSDE